MKLEYLVGIDYGDGETTAAIISISGNDKPRSLQIAKGAAKNLKKVDSAIVYVDDPKQGKIWRLPTNSDYMNASLETHFKRRPEDYNNDTVKYEAFCEFVTKIFERICINNSELKYNPATGEKNFLLYIACPSRWALGPDGSPRADSILKYKEIIADRIPVDAVIKESDAAFFHFLSKGLFKSGSKYLVIDYGSSTIDYTYYEWKNIRELPKFDGTLGYAYGAAKVEHSWLDHIKKQNTAHYTSKYDYLKALIKETYPNNPHLYPKIENGIRHKLKAYKEDYYSRDDESPDESPVDRSWQELISMPLKNFVLAADDSMLFSQLYTSKTIETEVLKKYKEDIEEELIRIRDKSWKPDNIMITGGASRMGWVNPMVRKVFKETNPFVKVKTDTETASYVVAYGIVSYMRRLHDYKVSFKIKRNELLQGECSKNKIEKLLSDAINGVVKDVFMKKLNETKLDFIYSDHNLNYLAKAINSYAANMGNALSCKEKEECNIKIAEHMETSIRSAIENVVHNSFKSNFKLDLYVDTKLDFTDVITSSFKLDAQATKFVKSAACKYVCLLPWEGVEHVNMHKVRTDVDIRSKIGVELESIYESKKININIGSNAAWKNSIVDKILNSVNRYLDEAQNKWPFDIY